MHLKLCLLLLFVIFKTVVDAENEDEESMRSAIKWSDSQLKIAYGKLFSKTFFVTLNITKTDQMLLNVYVGSMLNVSCSDHEDCFLKHSMCNPLTKRCECDIGSMQDNSRCK